MGGDHGPEVVVPGAALSLDRQPALRFIFFGQQSRIEAVLQQYPALAAKSRVVHTDLVVAMDEKPSQALRRGKGSSMWLPLEAVKKGEADAAVSAGNTGALMAMAKLVLRPMAGIERPAIAALWPTIKSECIVLDVGANIGATADQLADFALMGAAMARAVFHIERPWVGLLNVGVEEIKGNEEVKGAHALLKSADALPLTTAASSRATRSARGLSMSSSSRASPATSRSRPPKARRGRSATYLKAAMTSSFAATRRAPGQRRISRAQGEDGPAPRQWRHVPRPQRHCGQEPRRHRRLWLCECRRSRLRDGRNQV